MEETSVLPLELNQYPLDERKVEKLKPRLILDINNQKFKLLINLPGYKKDDIKVFAGNDKIMVKAMDKMKLDCINVYKVYEADYSLPPGVEVEKLRKSYHNDVLCLRGDIEKIPNNTKRSLDL